MPTLKSRYARRSTPRTTRKRLNGMLVAALGAISLLLFFCLWQPIAPVVAQAPSVLDLQQQQQSVDQQRQSVTQQRQQFQQQQGAAQQKLQGIQQNIQTTEGQIDANEAQLKQTQAELAQLEQDLKVATEAHGQRQTQTTARLRFLQRQRSSSTWATLLQSNTLEQLLERQRQLSRVYTADQAALVKLKAERERLRDQRLQVELKKNQIALISEQLHNQKANFEAEEKVQNDLVNRLRSDVRALEAAELQLAADSRRIATMLEDRYRQQQLQQGGGFNGLPALPGTTAIAPQNPGTFAIQMLKPVTGGRISSNFGYRVHPISKARRLHAGMDIAAPTGTPIYAAADGVVLTSGPNGGYGNCVIIDHGGGITTLYGHAHELNVSAGERVTQGQLVATVGSTGFSTGPHLHFEVRQRGTPVDPAPYIA